MLVNVVQLPMKVSVKIPVSSYIPTAMREIVKMRDGGRCQYCGKVVCQQPRDYNIDHIMAKANGGKTTLDNLHLLCPSCNSIKWTREIDDHTQYVW